MNRHNEDETSEDRFVTVVEHPYKQIGIEKRMLLNPNEKSTVPGDPPFVSPPPGSKPYYGFRLIPSTKCDGYTFGAVTDYLDADTDEGCTIGDGFVEAPEGTRAGLIWGVDREQRFGRIMEPDDSRWGVYFFTVAHAIRTEQDMIDAFAAMVPTLKRLHSDAKNRNM